MIRKLGVTALVAGLVMAAPVAAQQGGGMRMGGMGGAPSMEVLKQELALTSEQEPKIQKLLDAFAADTRESRDALMENLQMVRDGVVTREAVQADNNAAIGKIRERTAKLNEELKGVLTAEQYTRYEAYLEAQRSRMRGPRPPPVR